MSKRLADLTVEEKRDLLAKALRKKAQEAARVPLSYQQQGLWFLDQLESGNPLSNLVWAMRISGRIDMDGVQQALNEIVRRHEPLRTIFRFEGGEPVQVVSLPLPLPVKIIDLSELAPDEQEKEIQRLVREEARTPFDLATGPLLRVTLLRCGPEEHVASVTIHHIIADGWSTGVFARELWALYNAFSKGQPSPLPELPIQYRDYVRWQRERLQGDRLDRLLTYWKSHLQNAPHLLHVRTDRPRPPVMTYNGATVSFLLPKALSESLKELSRKEGVTLFMLLLAAFSVLLHRHVDQDEMLIGTPISGRERPETQGLIGFFVNTLALRIDLSGNPPFRQLLKRVRETTLEAYDHQDLPFNKLVEELQPPRDLSRSPLIQVMFALQNIPLPPPVYPGFSISPLDIDAGLARFDLALETIDTAHGIRGRFEYNTDLFDRVTIESLARQYESVLESIVSGPDQPIRQMSLLAQPERKQILSEWTATKLDYPETSCIHHLFEEQVERTPEAVALIFEGESLTYSELNRRANQVAHELRALGVGPEVLVGIYVERSLEMIVGLLAILKAGGAYVPLDPSYPKERLAFMVEDARVPVLLTQEKLRSDLPPHAAQIVCLDAIAPKSEIRNPKSEENPPHHTTARNLAYVIYTSGSTGRPKGVMVEHRSVVNVVTSFIRTYSLNAGDRVLQQASLSFDVSVNEIFPILSVGGAVVLPSTDDILDFEKLTRLMAEHHVTILGAVPSVLARLNALKRELPEVRLILSGGETLSYKDVDKLLESAVVTNGYGPTEATVCASCYDLRLYNPSSSASIPIGKPLANYQVYILDKDLECVPIGCPGELCIAGVGLARGYLNAPELTAEKFVPNPFAPGERLFLTGDLARWLPDGNIEFLGRMDRQIKIRGQRVELEEVEAVLTQHPAVEQAAVLDWEYAPGDERLVAYLVPNEQRAFPVRQLLRFEREGLLANLPTCELPNGMVIVHQNEGETEFLYKEIFEHQFHIEPPITLHDGDCIFDVGANIGLFTLFVSQRCQDAMIYAFEPLPPIFEKLRINTALYALGVKLFQCGLADKIRSEEFIYFPQASAMSGRFSDGLELEMRQREVRAAIKEYVWRKVGGHKESSLSDELAEDLTPEQIAVERFTCPVRTVSDVIRENEIESIDLLKIDVEKSELDVLAGVQEQDWPKIKQIVVEVQETGGLVEQIRRLLGSQGYEIEVRQRRFFKDSNICITNVYAVRPDQTRSRLNQPRVKATVGAGPMWSSPNRLLSDVRQFLSEKLPNYMLPSAFVLLDALPLLPNGKVDRRLLPSWERTESGQQEFYVPPRTPTEELVAGIWSQILGIERIGLHDNFFEVGGHSLLAAQVISRLRQTFQVDMPVRSFFEAPTVAALAEKIETARRTGDHLRTEPLRPVSRDQPLPLSFGQQGLWFLDQLQQGVPFHIPIAVRFSGPVQVDVLQRSLNELIRRHESLRTTFALDGGRPVQVIAETLELPLTEVNLSELEESERRARVRRMILEELRRPFDLSQGPLLRSTLWHFSPDDHVLFVVLHHIISDGWSVQVFVRELRTLYEAFSTGSPPALPELPIQYADFAYWQRQWFEGEEREIPQLSYWKQQLQGPLPVLELPADHPRPAISNFRGITQFLVLPASLSAALRELSRREGVTLFMMLLAAFKALLHRYTGEDDIIVGTPIAGRTRVETEGVIGYFVNLLALRTDLSGDPSFRELLGRVREVAVGAYTHQDLPYEKLVEILHPERGLSQTPLFRVMFIFEHTWPEGLQQLGLTPKVLESETEAVQDDSMPAAYDLLLTIVDGEQEMTAALHYRSDLFDAPTISRMLRCFQTLLESVVADPERRLSALPILTDQERRQLVVEYNATNADYPRGRCLHERFEAQVERTPEATAVVFEEDQLTYSELNRRANQLAHYLRRLGVGPEVLVGLYVERSVEMLVGLLGILKAGGAFVPLDPAYPKERLAFMLEDARVSVILTQERLAGGLPNHEVPVVALDSSWEAIAQECDENLARGVTAENLAYVMYTSGTTGNPNGVLIPHRAVVNHNAALARRLGLQPSDRILQFASISFDAAVEEIFPCLAVGATLVLRTDSMLSSVSAFLQKCYELELTVLDLPTAYWHELTSALCANSWTLPEQVRLVIIGGERALPERVEAWRKQVGSRVRLVNTYGPTETTVIATMCDLSESEGMPTVWPEVPIGRPIDNVQVYVLDEHLQPVPVGVPGELYIGGDGLARGYLNRPELTAEKFIPNPFAVLQDEKSEIRSEPGARLYKTGDRARYRADGHIEFLGRTDDQVKLRGFRVELSEIETKLRRHPLVEDARVIVREDAPDDKRLVAYYVPREESGVRAAELRRFLQNQLPDYMIPSQFVPLASLPLTSTGKLDRKSLPQPGRERPDLDERYVAPRNDTESALVGIWAELLRIDKIGVYDNFFALGGHSLLAVQLMGRVKEAFHVEIPLRILFESPTVAQLARRMEDLQSAPERAGDYTAFEASPLVPMQPSEGNPPLFCVHPLGGQIHCYRYLSRLLGEKYAVYGIQSRALADPAREHPTLASMAADYANVICEHFPNRPYNLLGWSSGGLLAMAIAEALEQKGERVSLVGLVDTYLLAGDEIPVGIGSAQNLIITLRETFEEEYPGFAHVWEHLIEQATSLYNQFLPLSDEERLERIFDWLETMKLAHGDFREVLRQQWILHTYHYSLLKPYKPPRIHAPLYVFWASETLPGITTPSPVDWSEYTSAGVRAEIVDGNHYTIMRPPAVQTISERLAARIKKA